MVAYTPVTDATLTEKKAFTQAVLRQNRDNDDHMKARLDLIGEQTAVFKFDDTSDVSIATVTPTGTLWSSSQSITIPTTGLFILWPFMRVDNASGAGRSYSIGLRINGTDYWQATDDNGSLIYDISRLVTHAEYAVFRGGLRASNDFASTVVLDIEGLGISTGAQTVQPIIGTDTSTATQTLKGTTVTSRLKVLMFEMV